MQCCSWHASASLLVLHVAPLKHMVCKPAKASTCRAPSLPPSLRQRSLTRLTEALHQQPDALFDAQQPASGAAEGAAALQPCSRHIVDAIWQLVRLSSELQDGQMAALAGESAGQATLHWIARRSLTSRMSLHRTHLAFQYPSSIFAIAENSYTP